MTQDAQATPIPDGPGQMNRRAVLREIVLHGPLSRTGIAKRLGLTMATISRITRELLDAGLVGELPEGREGATDVSRARPGRRPVRLSVDPRGGQVLGISIGSSLQTVTLADLGNQVIAGSELKLDTLDDPDLVIERAADEARDLIVAHLEERRRLLGGAVMVSGSVDPMWGNVRNSPFPGWDGFPLRSRLTDLLGLPIKVLSISNAVALAEARFGAAQGRNDVLSFICGLGLGAALILRGRLVENHHFQARALGSMPVTAKDGEVTTLDRLAGGRAILQRLHGDGIDLSGTAVTGLAARALHDAIERDRFGDPAVAALMTGAGRELGRVAALLARLAVPEIVVIAGPLSMSARYVAAAGEVVAEGLGDIRLDVVPGAFTGAVSGRSATCGLAICEYLFERNPDISALSADVS